MIQQNILFKSTKFVVKDILFDLVFWFWWWYTTGIKKAFLRMLGTISQGNRELGLTIWIKNIFRPMFGQYDWQGRIISFFVRVFQIIVRFVIFLFWILFSIIIFFLWILIPVFVISMVLFNTGMFGTLW